MSAQNPQGMGRSAVDRTAEIECRDGRIGSAALTANKAVRPPPQNGDRTNRITGLGVTRHV